MKLGRDASDEMIRTVTDNLAAASENVLSTASEWMTAISESFSASMSAAIDDFVKQATGIDLAGITESWELASENDERYLDDVNASYAIDKMERTFQKSIDGTDNLAAQKKLNSVMQEQLKMLREKDKLSQYDLDRANSMYELTLKQIALEEAQQTANKMKLTRDAMGNYTYQYVADEDAIAKVEEELADAENNLYNMDKDRTKELVSDYYATMSEANEAIAEAMADGDTERVERLRQYYFDPDTGLLGGIKSELTLASENLNSFGEELMGMDWDSSFKSFTDAIANSELNALATSLESLTSDTIGNLAAVTSSIQSLLTDTENSSLLTAMTSINETLKGEEEFAEKTAELMTATNNVLNKLPGLTSEVDKLVTELKSYGDTYVKWLKGDEISKDEVLKESIAATEDLTLSTDMLATSIVTLIDKLDNTDGDLTIAGYKYNDKTGLWEQLAEDSTGE
jgi:hypothetical protein